jgi:predicted amino acid-binding ACT domain protein
MNVLDHVRTSHEWNVRLALYHRGHLSLFPGTTVHLAPISRRHDNAPENGSATAGSFPEVIGTTIQRAAWGSVYRASISMYDTPGVVNQVLRSVARHGGNVLNFDSTSADQELHHDLEMIIDFPGMDFRRPERDVLAEIEGRLLGDCASHVVPTAAGGFKLTVRPITSLRRAHEMLSSLRVSGNVELVSTQSIGDRGILPLTPGIAHLLSSGRHPEPRRIDLPLNYFISSDTKDRVFRITFIPAAEAAVWCSIRHADRPGALASLTGMLKKHDVTILSSLNRVQAHHGFSWFEAVFSKGSWRDGKATRHHSSPREELARMLCSPPLQRYAPALFFDRRSAARAMRCPSPPSNRLIPPTVPEKLDSWLAAAERRLEHSIGESPRRCGRAVAAACCNETERLALATAIDRVRRASGRLRPQIFLSLEFTTLNQQRIAAVRDICQAVGVSLDVVRSSTSESIIWQEVQARLRAATHFLALWTPSEKKGAKGRRPSPWCLWELGAANALGLPFRVVIQKDTNTIDYISMHPSQYYASFDRDNTDEFRRVVREAVDTLIAHV